MSSEGQQLSIPPRCSNISQAEREEPTKAMIRRRNLLFLFIVFTLAALVDVVIASRSELWPDEVFSLATATGHSLEQPAAFASPTLGDFVEPDHPVPAKEFRHYVKHDDPPASPARVIRAVLLSDTNPPLYYLLLYGWTFIFGTSDIVLRVFSVVCSLACLPLLAGVARRTGGRGAVFPACVLFAFSPLAIYYSTEGRMYSLLWLCVLATTWASLILHQRGRGIAIYMLWIAGSVAGFLTHYFFVFPWLAILLYLLIRPGRLARRRLAACVILTSLLILPWYLKLPESLATWRISQGWLRLQPPGFDRWGASLGLITQPFSWQHVHQPSLIGYRLLLWRLVKHQWLIQHVHQPWIGYRVSYICALILFGFVGVAMVWRLRFHICGRGKLLLWLILFTAIDCLGSR